MARRHGGVRLADHRARPGSGAAAGRAGAGAGQLPGEGRQNARRLLPFENTQYRGNVFPGLAWSKGPYRTRSFVVIMQDGDVNYRGGPLLHWSMYDIPAGVTKLAAGMTTPPAGASFGPNVRGPNHAYMGPHTPPGPKHHYHFQLFALDQELPSDAALSYDTLAAAMTGHVLASGELIGLGQADPNAPPRAPATAPATAPPTKP